MTKILWEYNDLSIRNPLNLGALEHNQDSLEYEVVISHDSNRKISECGFYISPFSGDYNGTDSPIKDYERVLWLANNYPGHGLSIRQEYRADGDIDNYSNIRLIDLDRFENTDIFSGRNLEITSGPEDGNSVVIDSYDTSRKIFNLNNSFFSDVTGETYTVQINDEMFFRSLQGSSFVNPIPLINKGGIIERQERVTFYITMRIPKFAMSAGSFLFDLNLRFTSLDGE